VCLSGAALQAIPRTAGKNNSMLSFPITDKKDVYGVINLNSTSMKTFPDDEIYFVSIIANLILTAVKLRRKVASAKNTPS
jgi:transcriptional regulator with GAF, ATPase, and Fis domain